MEVRPTVAGGAEEDDRIDEQVQIRVLYGHGHGHDYNHDHDHDQQVEGKGELPVAEPDEQEDFDIEEEQEQVQVQVQRIQRVEQSVGTSGCLESVDHVPSVERLPEPHAMQRYLEGSGP